jgi:hypothetical protein
MSQREVMIVLAHALQCQTCRDRLLSAPAPVLSGRALTAQEKETLSGLSSEVFGDAGKLATAVGCPVGQIEEYRDHPVVRLRHF